MWTQKIRILILNTPPLPSPPQNKLKIVLVNCRFLNIRSDIGSATVIRETFNVAHLFPQTEISNLDPVYKGARGGGETQIMKKHMLTFTFNTSRDMCTSEC